MKICPYCHKENESSNKFCNFCGASLESTEESANTSQQPSGNYGQTQQPSGNYGQTQQPNSDYSRTQQYDSTYTYNNLNMNKPVEPVPIGGYVAWSILVLVFCTIPGVVALIYTFRINKATTVEEQQKLIVRTKNILMVGTILAVISIILTLILN